jgi:hypothetical protein
MNENDAKLTVWMLTLPGWGGSRPEECPERNYINPDIWPGGWTHFQNANAMVVAAVTEEEAREKAAHEDCPIWKDVLYARCRMMEPKEAGVIFMIRSGADNE